MSGLLSEHDLIETYRATLRPLYAYVSRRVGGDASLAEDLVQDTWMRAIDDWPSKGLPEQPLAWLIRVARNTIVSHFRRSRPELMEPALLDRLAGAPSAAAADDPGTAAIINWGLARLRRSHAELLEDFYFTGKSLRELALERSLSERAIEGRLRRAREKLRKKIARVAPPTIVGRPRTQDGGTEHVRRT